MHNFFAGRGSASVTLCLLAIMVFCGVSISEAAPCDSNYWQPTFVHDLQNPDGPWFVTPQLTFIKLRGNEGRSWTTHACELIQSSGVRDSRGFTTCQDYTRIQCGCSRSIPGNSTCESFLRSHTQKK